MIYTNTLDFQSITDWNGKNQGTKKQRLAYSSFADKTARFSDSVSFGPYFEIKSVIIDYKDFSCLKLPKGGRIFKV